MFTVKRKINQVLPKITTIELVSLKKGAYVQKVKFKAPKKFNILERVILF